MKLVFDASKLDKDNIQLISLLRLLGSLEYCIATMNWYVGEEANHTELPAHESILSMAINIASTAESLHQFEHFVRRGIINFSTDWSNRTNESWILLQSEKVKNFKSSHLKLIRDKSAFHIDPEPIIDYINKLSNSNESTIVLWETKDSEMTGHSPFASEVIANQLVNSSFANKETLELTAKIYSSLRNVVLASLNEILELKEQT